MFFGNMSQNLESHATNIGYDTTVEFQRLQRSECFLEQSECLCKGSSAIEPTGPCDQEAKSGGAQPKICLQDACTGEYLVIIFSSYHDIIVISIVIISSTGCLYRSTPLCHHIMLSSYLSSSSPLLLTVIS